MCPIALITGADHGLGLGIAQRLVELGWKVYAGQYNSQWGELGTLARKFPERLFIVPQDVSSDESIQESVRYVSNVEDHLDMLINNAGVISAAMYSTIKEAQDYEEMMRLYNTNALGALRVVEGFLPLLDKGQMKRLCFVSSEAGSINACERTSWYGYCLSKTALNMGAKILFNRLRPEGYTFRLYHPGWVRSYMSGKKDLQAELEPEQAARYAVEYFLRNRSYEPGNEGRSDENRLVMRDWRGREWPW